MLYSRLGFTNLLWLILAVACSPVMGALETGNQSSIADATVALPPINQFFKLNKEGVVGEFVNGAQLWIEVTDTACGLTKDALAQPAKLYMESLVFPVTLKAGCSYAMTLYLGKIDPSVDPNKLAATYAWNQAPVVISKEQIAQHLATNGTSPLSLPLALTLSDKAQEAGIESVGGGSSTAVPVTPVTPVTPPPSGPVTTLPPGGPIVPSTVPGPTTTPVTPTGAVSWNGGESMMGINAETNAEMKISDVMQGRKYALVVASARWCGPCKGFYGQIAQAIKSQNLDKGCAIIITGGGGGGLDYADGKDMAGILAKNGGVPAKYGFVMDKSEQRSFYKKVTDISFSGIPDWSLVGADGKRITQGSGSANFNDAEFDVCKKGS